MSFDDSRTAREIGERALIVGFILSAFKLRGQETHPFAELIKAAESSVAASDRELLFRGDWTPKVQQDLLWQVECLHVLLWAVGLHSNLLPPDEMVAVERVVPQINSMGSDVASWLSSLERRPVAELAEANELLDLWLWRARDGLASRPGFLSPGAHAAISGAVSRGVLSRDHTMDDDIVAFGQPFHRLTRDQKQLVEGIVRERVRAIRWIWRDFDDWWAPNLDS